MEPTLTVTVVVVWAGTLAFAKALYDGASTAAEKEREGELSGHEERASKPTLRSMLSR